MKRTLLALSLVAATSPALAASLGISAGAYYWQTDARGVLSAPAYQGYNLKLDEKTLTDEANAFFFVALEHPIPVLPNIRVAHTRLQHSGSGNLFFNGTLYSFQGSIDLSHTDITAYYQLLDHVISLDLGLTARQFDGYISATTLSKVPLDSTYALLFGELAVNIPLTGITLGSNIQAGDTGDERAIDFTAYMKYTSPIGLGITAGYRHLEIDMESEARGGGVKVKLFSEFEASGPFFALHYQF